MPSRPIHVLLQFSGALLLGCVFLCHPRDSPTVPPLEEEMPEAVWASDVAPTVPGVLLGGLLKATGPLPGQKRPPCTPVRERLLVGACWIGTEHQPPCPEGVYEVDGRCVLPVEVAKRPNTSVGP
jgi:hypothetical protein